MARNNLVRCLVALALVVLSSVTMAQSVVEKNGALSVKGVHIVNQADDPVSFAGPSLFWSNNGWNADVFYNSKAIGHIKQQWNASITRAAIGVEYKGGYLEAPEDNTRKAFAAIDAAIEQGLYILVDWHSHKAQDSVDKALEFFTTIATKYGHYPNIIYEIYNEPLKEADWSTVIKPYANKVIAKIRSIDADNLIIVGTQTWSQDVDKAALDPITGFDNIAYTLHFYAATHKQELRDKAQFAIDHGLPIMVTEWGTVLASADGAPDIEETNKWLDFMRKNKLSHCNWSLNDRDEGASIFKPGTNPTGPWTQDDLTPSGKFVTEVIKNWDRSIN